MPKTPSVLLRMALEKRQIELLDIYHSKEKDLIRVKDKLTGKVILYESKRHVRDLTGAEEIEKLVDEIEKALKSK